MANWLTRTFGRKDGIPFNAAMQDVMSVLYPDKGQMSVTDARTAVDRSVWIYRAVSTVSTRIGSLPWHLMNGDKVVEGKSAVLTRPSPNQTGTEFVERIIAWMMLNGTGMVYVEKPAVRGITVLDADMVHIDQGGNIQYRDGKSDRQLDKSNIVLFPNFSLSGQLGLSELRPILDTANMDEGAKQVWNAQMSSGGALAGLMTTDFKLTGPELMAAKKAWEEKYSGIQKAGGIGWLSAGYHFEKLGISAADLKLLEVSKVTREEIGAAFGVPGVFLNDTQSVDYSNAQTQERILYSNTIIPKADRLADRITTFLLPLLPGLKGLTFKFDYTGIECLQGDKLQKVQIDETMLRSGVISINEIRKRDGIGKPVAGGEAPMISAMLVPLGAMTVYTRDEVAAVAQAIEDTSSAGTSADANSSPADEGKAIQKGLHTPEARLLIAKAFIAKTAPQEKKFASVTMGAFHKQEKRIVAWLDGGKSIKDWVSDLQTALHGMVKDEDLIEGWHGLYYAFGMQSAEEVAARYSMAVPDGSAILAWVKKQEKLKSKLVNETTMGDVNKIISDLKAQGSSIPDMVKATKEYFGGVSYRAERVARTEVISCNNAAAQETYKENGVAKHEWLSTSDDRTRPDHVEADGQVAGIDEGFTVGGESLMYPGDPSGSPENVIQCRCTLLPVI